jgi:hypothetical protein
MKALRGQQEQTHGWISLNVHGLVHRDVREKFILQYSFVLQKGTGSKFWSPKNKF